MRRALPKPVLTPRSVVATTFEIDGVELVLFEIFESSLFRSDLTISENSIVALLATGLSTGEIATRRGVSYRTIANQLASIYRKASANSREELLSTLRAGQLP